MLELLDFDPSTSHGRESVAILVGPNGAGKSRFLRKLASEHRYSRNLAIICNTAYDRFSGMRGIKRISAGRGQRSPKAVVKDAVANTLDDEDSRFYQMARILEYCGYSGRIGFRLEWRGSKKYFDRDPLSEAGGDPHDIDLASRFFEGLDPREIIWVGDRGRLLDFSKGREFASVLRLEALLRAQGYLRDIEVYLERIDGPIIELQSASSGELALISSLLFLIANRDHEPVVLVDEPENSLHPTWQREYVDKILNALEYRGATIVIATHAPLVVTGALASSRDLVSVFRIAHGEASRLDLSDPSRSTESIEEILWRAFGVITPSSHYVSERLVGVVGRVENGEIGAEAALAYVDRMNDRSFDSQQQRFFGAVRELISKVAAEQTTQNRDG